MKTLFSILFSLMIAGGGIVLAMNAPQDDPRCFVPEHDGYEYNGTPPAGSSPTNLPSGMRNLGQFGPSNDFYCIESTSHCHWVYNEEEEKWVPCAGDLVEIGPKG